MTIAELLINAQAAIALASAFPVGAQVTLALQLLKSTVTVIQNLYQRGILDPTMTIEVDDIGLELTKNIQAQLDELGPDPVA